MTRPRASRKYCAKTDDDDERIPRSQGRWELGKINKRRRRETITTAKETKHGRGPGRLRESEPSGECGWTEESWFGSPAAALESAVGGGRVDKEDEGGAKEADQEEGVKTNSTC